MSDQTTTGSIGIVSPQIAHIIEPLALSCGRTLASHKLVYEAYGELNQDRSNAILICHALSGHHHAAGKHHEDDKKSGWWDLYIGPNKPIDTNLFYVVVPSNLGTCFGSTGPNTINEETGRYWGSNFPQLRFRDWVNSQRQLADLLGVDCWAAVIGASLGGMQAMRWALEYPERLKHSVVIASALSLTPQNIAFNKMARMAIKSDPNFYDGDYLQRKTKPNIGLVLARMIANVTYLSDSAFSKRFGRELSSGSFEQGQEGELRFEVESYLNYKANQFAEDFDANSYLLISRMLDLFDLAREYEYNAVTAFSQAKCNFLVVSFDSDWRFSAQRSKEIVQALIGASKNVSYLDVQSDKGHDSFLLPIKRYQQGLQGYLAKVSGALC